MPFARSFQTKMDSEVNGSVDENPDNVLELAIDLQLLHTKRVYVKIVHILDHVDKISLFAEFSQSGM